MAYIIYIPHSDIFYLINGGAGGGAKYSDVTESDVKNWKLENTNAWLRCQNRKMLEFASNFTFQQAFI